MYTYITSIYVYVCNTCTCICMHEYYIVCMCSFTDDIYIVHHSIYSMYTIVYVRFLR